MHTAGRFQVRSRPRFGAFFGVRWGAVLLKRKIPLPAVQVA